MVDGFGAEHVHGVQRIGHGLQVPPREVQIDDGVLELDVAEQVLGKSLTGGNEDKIWPTVQYHLGRLYFKKGDYKAAAGRFSEATKWNAGNAQAWLRLGETEEKEKDSKAAREAYEKYLEVAADAKNAGEIRQRVERLKK